MQVKMTNPKSKETIFVDCEDKEIDFEKFKPILPESQIDRYINNLNISAEAKVVIIQIKDITVEIGGKLIVIGRKTLESIIYLIKKHPNTIVGGIIGATIGLLISSIPIIGWLFSWLITPLCTALGLAYGFWNDMREKDVHKKIMSHINELYGELKHIPAKG